MNEVPSTLLREGGRRPESASRRLAKSLVLLLLLAGLAARILYVLSQPLHGGDSAGRYAFNDEASHWNHVLLFASTGFPGEQRMGVREAGALERGEVEYSQPPLYYWISGALIRATGGGQPSHILIRLFSLLCWFAALHLLYRYAPFEAAKLPLILGGTLLGAGLIPSTTVNNDALFALTIAGLYVFVVMIARSQASLLRLLNLALLFALAIWTKLAALALAPMVLAAAWVAGPREKAGSRLLLVGVVSVWATLPLWLHRYHFYGSPLSIGFSASGELPAFSLLLLAKGALYSLVMPWMEYWGHPAVKVAALGFLLLMAGSLLLWAVRWGELISRIRESGATTATLLWTIGGLGSTAAWLYYALRYQQSEARLLLPAAPGLAILLGWPLVLLDGTKRKLILALLILFMVIPYIAPGVG